MKRRWKQEYGKKTKKTGKWMLSHQFVQFSRTGMIRRGWLVLRWFGEMAQMAVCLDVCLYDPEVSNITKSPTADKRTATFRIMWSCCYTSASGAWRAKIDSKLKFPILENTLAYILPVDGEINSTLISSIKYKVTSSSWLAWLCLYL